MTLFLIDVNVWIALSWNAHAQHRAADAWNQRQTDSTFLFCRFTMLGVLRLLTTTAMMGDRTNNISQALDIYEGWLKDARVEFRHEPRGISGSLLRTLEHMGPQQAPKVVADCYLAAFAESSGACLVTFDKALAQLATRRNIEVELLRPE